MNFSVPGKTFLAGEYSVLLNGSALGLATKPCFEVNVAKASVDLIQKEIFHPESPAGRYLNKFSNADKKNFELFQIEDPYLKLGIRGGFGKSTAEFLAAISGQFKKLNFQQIRQIYLDLHTTETQKPSGVDLAFQYFGQVCLANLQTNTFTSFAWPFAELDFFIVATGLKIATHQHLAELKPGQLKHLPAESDHVVTAFLKKDLTSFVSALENWCDVLQESGLTHVKSSEIKQVLQQDKNVLLVKPCGALGADVIIVFFHPDKKQFVKEKLTDQHLQIVASVGDLCHGVSSYVG